MKGTGSGGTKLGKVTTGWAFEGGSICFKAATWSPMGFYTIFIWFFCKRVEKHLKYESIFLPLRLY